MTRPAPASALVFVGDSITDAGRDRGDAGSLGDGFVSLVADELGRGEASVRVVNVGIAGNRAVDLAGRAVERGVAVVPGTLFYPDGRGNESLRLAFSLVPADEIDAGIELLGSIL